MYKGLAKDESTLRSLNIKNGDKLMLIGSKPQDVAQVMQKSTVAQTKTTSLIANAKKEPLSTELPHKKVIEKYGKPEDCMPGDRTKSVLLYRSIYPILKNSVNFRNHCHMCHYME